MPELNLLNMLFNAFLDTRELLEILGKLIKMYFFFITLLKNKQL